MCYFHSVCCICLSKKRELKQMFGSEGDRDYYTKLTSCIPEMHFKEMDNMKVMCKECCDTVDMMYDYRGKCIRSKSILIRCISQLGSSDNASCDLSVLLTNIANMKQEKCSETEYETTTGITDGNVPLPDQVTVPNEYEERKMLLASDNANQCDSDLSNIIKIENIDLHSSDTELSVFSSDEIPLHDPLNDDELAANEIKVEKSENIDLHFSDRELDDSGSDDISLHDPLGDDELAANETKVEIDTDEQSMPESEEDIDVFKSFLKCEKPDNEMNNDDVSVPGTSVGTESSNKESKFTRKRNLLHKCNICNKKFTQKQYLPRHMLTHSDEKPHKCEICGKSFSIKSYMSRHMVMHTGEKPHKCEICTKSFRAKQTLSDHMMTHTGEKPYKCEICAKHFRRSGDIALHMMTHTDEKPHKCEICAKSFGSKRYLSEHIKIHTGEKPHKCEICAKSFNSKYKVSLHMRTHTGVTPHKCEICSKQFSAKKYLSTHMVSHTGERPHRCEICTKQFVSKRNMSDHMITHTGEKPHKCEICAKSFRRKQHMSHHMMTHTGEEPQM